MFSTHSARLQIAVFVSISLFIKVSKKLIFCFHKFIYKSLKKVDFLLDCYISLIRCKPNFKNGLLQIKINELFKKQ